MDKFFLETSFVLNINDDFSFDIYQSFVDKNSHQMLLNSPFQDFPTSTTTNFSIMTMC